jgi:hypothetical protein
MTIQADLPLNSQDVPSFQSFLRHRLPQRIEDELRSIIQERFQPIEDDLRNTLDIAGIVETHVEELTRSWLDRGSPTGLLGETLPEQNDDIFHGDHSYPASPAPTGLLGETLPEQNDDIFLGDHSYPALPAPTGLLGETLLEQNDDIFLGDHSYPASPAPTGLLGETLPEQNDDIFLGDHSYLASPALTWEAEVDLLTESIPDVLDRGNGLLDHPSPGNLGDIAVDDQLWDFFPVPPESDMSEHTEQFDG